MYDTLIEAPLSPLSSAYTVKSPLPAACNVTLNGFVPSICSSAKMKSLPVLISTSECTLNVLLSASAGFIVGVRVTTSPTLPVTSFLSKVMEVTSLGAVVIFPKNPMLLTYQLLFELQRCRFLIQVATFDRRCLNQSTLHASLCKLGKYRMT